MALSDEQLTLLCMASPQLDEVEASLRATGKDDLADRLNKLQQDAGVEWVCPDPNITTRTPVCGPQSKALYKAFKEENTLPIFSKILCEAHDGLPRGQLKTDMSNLIKQLQPPRKPSIKAHPKTPGR
jgi:hypothetical protein